MKTNSAGIALIKEFEGLRLTAYKDPVGIFTIGYGHTSAAGNPIVRPGMKITADDAGDILVADLRKYEIAVISSLDKFANENQFSAMVSLCYNIGPGNFKKSSVIRYFNAGQPAKAADAFLLWNKAGGKILPGLTRRRKAERELFLTPVQNVIPERPTADWAVEDVLPPSLPEIAASEPDLGFWQRLWKFITRS